MVVVMRLPSASYAPSSYSAAAMPCVDAAVHLPVDDLRVDGVADVVDGDVADEPRVAGLRVDPPNFSWPGRRARRRRRGRHRRPATRASSATSPVDDVGNPVNPQIIDGQVHGGVTQGIAAALFEEGVVRRGGQPAHDDDGDVPRPVRGRAAVVRDGPHRDRGRQPARA